jgi:lipid-A-disaccharide synthase-like uncharacterized protein
MIAANWKCAGLTLRPTSRRGGWNQHPARGLTAIVAVLLVGGPSAAVAVPPDEPASSGIKLDVAAGGGAPMAATLLREPDGTLRFEIAAPDGARRLLTPEEFARGLYEGPRRQDWLAAVLNITSPIGFLWVSLGLGGQLLFTGRMLVQWLASERRRRSVVPVSFWWMSLVGASMLMVYFIWRKDLIGVIGQSTGWVIYIRNLWLIYQSGATIRAGEGSTASTA